MIASFKNLLAVAMFVCFAGSIFMFCMYEMDKWLLIAILNSVGLIHLRLDDTK